MGVSRVDRISPQQNVVILASAQGSVETKEKTMNNIKPGDLCVVDSCCERVCFIVDESTPTFVSGTRVNLLQYRDDQPEFPCPAHDSWAPYVKPKKVSALREQVKLCGAPLVPDSQMREFARFEILLDELFSFEPPCEIAVSFEFALTLDDLLEALRKIRDENDEARLRKWALGFYQFLLPSVKKVVDSGGELFILHSESSRSNKSQNLDLLPLFETSDLDGEDKDGEDKDDEEKDDEDDNCDDEKVSFVSRDGDSPIFPTESSVLYSVCQDLFKTLQTYAVLRDPYFSEDVALDLGKFRFSINELIKKVEICVENRDLPPVKRYYEQEVKRRFVETVQWALDCLTKEDIALFVRFVDELCDAGDKTAMEIKARACYEGNDAYKRDFDVARDLLLKLTQEDDFDLELFFTLGTIYFEGSCNDGQAENDKAFYYFSLAALGGHWDARLRVANMLRQGIGAPKNHKVFWEAARALYQEKFEFLFKAFKNRYGVFPRRYDETKIESDFTEGALLVGDAYRDGFGVEKSWENALRYYLQAEYAFDGFGMRIAKENRIGFEIAPPDGDWDIGLVDPDSEPVDGGGLYFRIKRAIREMERLAPDDYFKEGDDFFFKTESLDPFLKGTTLEDASFKATVKKLNDKKFLLKLEPTVKKGFGNEFLLTIPQKKSCWFCDDIVLEVEPSKIDLRFSGDYASFNFDEHNQNTGEFYSNGEVVACVKGEFTWSEEATFENAKRKFVAVKFKSGYKTYDYLCDLDDVQVGDRVVVPTSRGEEIVEVQKVFERLDSESTLPIGVYKRVVRKVDK